MPTISQTSRVCLLAFTISGLLVGCKERRRDNSASHPLPEPPAVANCGPGRFGGELQLALDGIPKNFSPFSNDAASQELAHFLFASLTSMDWQTQEIRPALAESWQVAPDGKTWTFKLRHGLHWSDGQPLTADDVMYTWNNAIYGHIVPDEIAETFNIGGTNFLVSKVDDLTVKVVSPEVFAPFLEFFGGVPILPRHVIDRSLTQNHPNVLLSQIACSGPFRLKTFNSGSSVVLERNPEYWAADKTGQRLPYFDHVILTSVFEPAAATQLFLDGKVDACQRVALDEYDMFQKQAATGKIQLLNAGLTLEKEVMWFNENTGTNPVTGQPIVNPVRLKWFRNQKFRQAVALAIDRERIVKTVYGGHAEPSYGFLGEENKKWNNPNIARAVFNPARARTLLAEIGLTNRNSDGALEDADGHTVEIVFSTNFANSNRMAMATLIAEDLRKLGIRVDLQTVPFPQLVQRLSEGDYECVLLGLGGGGLDPVATIHALKSGDPGCQWFPAQKSPSTEWEARIDSLMDEQLHTLDFAARKKAFDEVQAILAEQLPMVFIASPFAYTAVANNIGNVRPSALTPYRATWNVDELYRK